LYLNKRYSPPEYQKTVSKVIEQMILNGEWGKFFPGGLSHLDITKRWQPSIFPCPKNRRSGWDSVVRLHARPADG